MRIMMQLVIFSKTEDIVESFRQQQVVSAPLELPFHPYLSLRLGIVKSSLDHFPILPSPEESSQPIITNSKEGAYYI